MIRLDVQNDRDSSEDCDRFSPRRFALEIVLVCGRTDVDLSPVVAAVQSASERIIEASFPIED